MQRSSADDGSRRLVANVLGRSDDVRPVHRRWCRSRSRDAPLGVSGARRHLARFHHRRRACARLRDSRRRTCATRRHAHAVPSRIGVRPESSPLLEREIAATRPRGADQLAVVSRPGRIGRRRTASPRRRAGTPNGPRTSAGRRRSQGSDTPRPSSGATRIFLTTAVSSSRIRNSVRAAARRQPVDDRTEQDWRVLASTRRPDRSLGSGPSTRRAPRGPHLKSSFATATPATDGRRVVALFGSEGLYCYDFDGTLLWKKDLGTVGHSSYGFGSSPIIYRDMVDRAGRHELAASRGHVRPASSPRSISRTDANAGGRRATRTRSSFGTPMIYEGVRPGADHRQRRDARARVRSGDRQGNLVARRAVRHRHADAGRRARSDLRDERRQRVSADLRHPSECRSGDITLKPGSGANDFVVWSTTRGGSFTPTPIVYGDYLYSINVSGILGCYDARTGERQYLQRLEHPAIGFSSSPVAADGRTYLVERGWRSLRREGRADVRAARDQPMSEVIMATPAVSSGMIFSPRRLGHLVAVDTQGRTLRQRDDRCQPCTTP